MWEPEAAPGSNGLFDISVCSFTMIHTEMWIMWQIYSTTENIIYILNCFPLLKGAI